MKAKAGSLFGAVSRRRQRVGWAAIVGCGLVAVLLASTVHSRRTEALTAKTKNVVLDVAVDGRSPFHVAVPEGSAVKMTLAGGPRLELVPKASGDELDVQVVNVAFDPATGEETRSTVGRLRLERGVPATIQVGTSSIAVVWVDVKTG